MIRLFLCTGIILLMHVGGIAQGKYGGTKKAMIGKTFIQSTELTALKGWEFIEGNLANSLDDPERIMCEVYRKGTTWVVFFSIMEDTASGKFKVMDVVEVTGVTYGWAVRGAHCRLNEQENNYIIAWCKVKDSDQFVKFIRRAWRFNPDKRRFEIIPVKGIDCENVGC